MSERALALWSKRKWAVLGPVALLLATPALAQHMHDMPGMTMPPPAAEPAPAARPSPPTPQPAPAHDMGLPGMDHGAMNQAGMDHTAMNHGTMPMQGMLGRYPMTREGSGTSWQPDSSPMRSAMVNTNGWMLMEQASATFVYDRQGGPRGGRKAFSESMAMLMAGKDVSPRDRIALRAMLSLDPAMGPAGYPLLFATGETADGHEHLIDRQHPHDLFMEMAVSIAHDLGGGYGVSLYAGLPGEPALGPVTFMHRISAQDNPEAPIGHHWFDSSHITFGVVTLGLNGKTWKIEGSAFRGREPDQHRWDMEAPKLDSWSVRGFYNPTANVSLQLSTGRIHSPESLDPNVDEQRTTASASWNLPLGQGRNLSAMVAWSAKDLQPGPTLHAWLGEAAYKWGGDQVYGRVERVQENELFHHGPLAGRVFPVGKLSLGYQHEFAVAKRTFVAFGALGSAYDYGDTLRASYGAHGVKSFMLYGRLRFGS